jgi:amino acid adenylation domain-containing protein
MRRPTGPPTDTREAQGRLREQIRHPHGTYEEFPKEELDRSIVERFEEQAAKHPDHVVLRSTTQERTYQALDRHANRVARALLSRLGPGAEPVGLVAPHDVQMVEALVGVLKSGKFYVPLDPGYPIDRLRHMARDSGVRAVVSVLAHRELATSLAADAASVILLDDLADVADTPPGLTMPPDAYAYLLYTSGSTGTPKGVIENHRDVKHFTRVFVGHDHLCREDVLSGFWSLSFSGLAANLYQSLLVGARLLIVDPNQVGMAGLNVVIRQERLSLLSLSAPMFRAMVEADTVQDGFPSIRVLRFGGSAAGPRDIRLALSVMHPRCFVRHSFGLSEIKNVCSYVFAGDSRVPDGVVPVGYEVEDTEVRLLDEAGGEAGPGEVGEVVVRSPFVCPGYWNQPALNRERFGGAPNGSPGRYFRTGDLGVRDANGCLHLRGRKDFQAKIRGYRIEPHEIEVRLAAIPGVREAAVAARTARDGESYLAAYVVPGEGMPSLADLRRRLAEALPSYMPPAVFVELARLPVTPSGKLDRQALPEPVPDTASREGSPPDGRSDLEEAVARVWRDVLGLAEVGVHDEFLLLGGDSLKAHRVLARLREHFGVELPINRFFDAKSVADQARLIEELRAPDTSPGPTP